MTGTSSTLSGKAVFLSDIAGAFGPAIATAIIAAGGRLVAGCGASDPPAAFAGVCVFHDPADAASWPRALDASESRIGRLTSIVNNAETIVRGSIEELDTADWRRARAGGLDAAMYAMRSALPRLRHVPGSSVVNLCSIAGEIGLANYASLCATAFAMRSMTRSAAIHAKEKRYSTRFNCVIAGFDQDGSLAKVLPELSVDPEDVATMIVFLLSDAARGATGAEFTIDGGGSLHPA